MARINTNGTHPVTFPSAYNNLIVNYVRVGAAQYSNSLWVSVNNQSYIIFGASGEYKTRLVFTKGKDYVFSQKTLSGTTDIFGYFTNNV